MDRKTCIYAGSGAVLAKDVEVAFDKLAIPWIEVDEHDIIEDKLEDCSVLCVPGGYTESYVEALGEEGFERIRQFVAGGGGYIGICAGAYLAPQRVEVAGHPPGLGIITIRNERRAGMELRTITITQPEHPLVEGCGKEIEIWYKNGPMIEPGQAVEMLAVYEEGPAAIVCSRYGQGQVIIFSPHPEGSLGMGADPEKLGTLKLLGNAVAFASKGG